MSKVNVLIVDDASFIRDLMKKGLRSQFPGIQLEEAVNGRKAQQIIAAQSFDLILCDWEMPEMSGLELLSWFRQQVEYKAVPFIMVTSRGDKENVVQAIQAGVTDYIGKPFTQEQLITKVSKALSRSGRLQALQSSAPVRMLSTGVSNDSLSVLTGQKTASLTSSAPITPVARNTAAPSSASSSKGSAAALSGQGQASLRLSNGEF